MNTLRQVRRPPDKDETGWSDGDPALAREGGKILRVDLRDGRSTALRIMRQERGS